MDQLEETITRLKSERAELMLTVEQGEGSSTIIHQLQQENVISFHLFFYQSMQIINSYRNDCKKSWKMEKAVLYLQKINTY